MKNVWSCILLLCLMSLPLPTQAATTLFCPSGDTPCVIDAILQANEAEETTLILEAGVYVLHEPDPESFVEGATALPIITSILTIQGQGSAQTFLSRHPLAPLFRLFVVAETGVLTLERLSLESGAVDIDQGERGGGVLNFGTLRLEQAVLHYHSAWISGAIDNQGVLDVDSSSISDNYADLTAGGVGTLGPTTIRRSLLARNVSDIDAAVSWDPRAGVVEFRQSVITEGFSASIGAGGVGGTGQARLVDTVVSNNRSAVWAGGITVRGANSEVTLLRSTVVGNRALVAGAGIVVSGGRLHLRQSQVLSNVVVFPGGNAGGIENRGGEVRAQNSLILGNQATTAPDCQGTIITQGNTIVGDPSGCNVIPRARD